MSGGILIAGSGSGCGKTTFACALLRALARREITPCAFKCGPDYIDPSFHTRVLGVPSYNLDPFFTEREVLRQLYERHSNAGKISVVEGVMGYYDGIGFGEEASTYKVACALGIPVILLVDCRGMGGSVMAVLEGYARHRNPSMIEGVIFNRLAPSLYEKASREVQTLGIQALGYLPERRDMQFASRHLGLVMADEVADFAAKADAIAQMVEETVDEDGILRMAEKGAADWGMNSPDPESPGMTDICRQRNCDSPCIAVARDEAFCFLYEDNLNFLRERGARIAFFSPLYDESLPPGCKGLYLSGGYPELYAAQLEDNISMRKNIRRQLAGGIPCIAECGGFLYLHDRLEADGAFYKMTGVINGDALQKSRKGHFGYLEATLLEDCLLGEKGATFRVHEFHYWESTMTRADPVSTEWRRWAARRY